MRHAKAGKKLGRDSAHRKALYSNLAGALIEHGRIQTTEAKAKAVKPFAEKMITLGKRGDLHARRQALSALRSNDIVHHLFAEVAPRFAERPGGYTRIVKLGQRTDYDKLRLDVTTDGSIAPKDAIAEAAEILIKQLAIFTDLEKIEGFGEAAAEAAAEATVSHGMENFPIEELELGVRSYNCLKRVGIETIGDLTSKTESELAAIPNFGRKSIDEVRETLAAHGLTLKGEELPQ